MKENLFIETDKEELSRLLEIFPSDEEKQINTLSILAEEKHRIATDDLLVQLGCVWIVACDLEWFGERNVWQINAHLQEISAKWQSQQVLCNEKENVEDMMMFVIDLR